MMGRTVDWDVIKTTCIFLGVPGVFFGSGALLWGALWVRDNPNTWQATAVFAILIVLLALTFLAIVAFWLDAAFPKRRPGR